MGRANLNRRAARRACCLLPAAICLLWSAPGCALDRAPWVRPAGPAPNAVPGQGPALTGVEPDPAGEEAANQRALSREMADRLADAEQEKARLAARVRELEGQLAEKDRALAQAQGDVQAGAEEVARTRAELKRWNEELAAVRAKLQATEKDNVATLKAIAAALEQMAGRGQAPAPQPPPRP
ncbi:MAG TPA: hypothetical protein VFA26_06620 [Gemmataceae bacterium]|nr:hypothetical protein [Gemmataceae bacterium]